MFPAALHQAKLVQTAVFFALGLLFIALSIPLMLERVGPNRWYGFRVAKTLSDPRVWYPANRIMGYDMTAAGALVCITSFVLFVFVRQCPPGFRAAVNLGVLLGAVAASLVHGFLVLRRL